MPGLDGFGTQFQRGDGADPEVFTAIGNVLSVSGPSRSRATLDMSSQDSPDQYNEFLGGFVNGGEVSFDVNYDPAKHDSLNEDFHDPLPRNYKIVFPDDATTTWAFKAVMTAFEPTAPHDDKMTASLSFQVSGKPTIS